MHLDKSDKNGLRASGAFSPLLFPHPRRTLFAHNYCIFGCIGNYFPPFGKLLPRSFQELQIIVTHLDLECFMVHSR